MRKNIFRFVIAAALVSAFAACQKNNDTTPSSGTTTLDRDKFIGTWHVTSHHTVTTTQYWDMTVVAGSSDSEILLDNFDQIGSTHSITASVSGSNFSFSQSYNGTAYHGSGSYSGGNLSFNYTADDGVQVDTVTATAHK